MKQYAQHGFSNLDFDFLLELASHRNLPLRQGLLLMHLLGKVGFRPRNATAAPL